MLLWFVVTMLLESPTPRETKVIGPQVAKVDWLHPRPCALPGAEYTCKEVSR